MPNSIETGSQSFLAISKFWQGQNVLNFCSITLNLPIIHCGIGNWIVTCMPHSKCNAYEYKILKDQFNRIRLVWLHITALERKHVQPTVLLYQVTVSCRRLENINCMEMWSQWPVLNQWTLIEMHCYWLLVVQR